MSESLLLCRTRRGWASSRACRSLGSSEAGEGNDDGKRDAHDDCDLATESRVE